MENTKIGNKEAIALLTTITFNHIVLSMAKKIVETTASSSLLNILYVGIITLIFTCIICYFLNKFPTFDLIDISNYLGGNVLKWIVGILYVIYFIFFAGISLHTFSSFLQIIYFPMTKIFYIILLFVIATFICCNMKHNAVYRSTFIVFPLLIISTLFLFLANMDNYEFEKIYPLFGNGYFETFVLGLSNMFAFQGLAHIYFMPPLLKEPNKVKHIAVTSIIFSCIFLLIGVSIILFMFNAFIETDTLLPLYSASKYIEFGPFFQKLRSTFVLIWIISFISYLCINLKFSSNILKKLSNFNNETIFTFLLSIGLLFIALWPQKYAVSNFISGTVYKCSFFILVIGLTFLILLFATLKQKIRRLFNK